ncbi:MAG: class II SORL domain-containing protein [Coriobacteriia bacterium]|nr:class II SORL domain-containing protein [Coriobacteriia bacterium]
MSFTIDEGCHVIQDINTAPDYELKHTPKLEIIKGEDLMLVRVTIGLRGIGHPQTEEHFIEWIRFFVEGELIEEVSFKAGDVPYFEYSVVPGADFFAMASCNLHGMWLSYSDSE